MPLESLIDDVSSSPWTYAVVLAGTGDLHLGLVIAAGAAGAYAGDATAFSLLVTSI